MRNAIYLICGLLLITQNTHAAERIKRIAVVEFENASPDRTLDWIGTWLGEEFAQQAEGIPSLTVVDRRLVDSLLREFKLARSQYLDPDTARKMGKLMGADSLLTGAYQVVRGVLELAAHITDVETGAVRVTARVEGPYSDVRRLQSEVVRKLLTEILASPVNLEPFPDRNIDAYRALSDGIYFLRNGLLNDALSQFDRALALEKNYPEADYYRGLVLGRLEKWPEAIAAFKHALPGITPARRVIWSWQAPFAGGATSSSSGPIVGVNVSEGRADPARTQKRILFAERTSKGTRIYTPDLGHRRVRQIELADSNIVLNTLAPATGSFTVVTSADRTRLEKFRLYVISAAGDSLWWTAAFPVVQGHVPAIAVTADSVYVYNPADHRLSFFDARTGRQRWSRTDVGLDTLTNPIVHGNTIIVKTATDYRAIHTADGSDVWVFSLQQASASEIENGHVLAIFEHGAAFALVDMESGEIRMRSEVAPGFRSRNASPLVTITTVPSAIDSTRLYLLSADSQLIAADLENWRILWTTPLAASVTSLRAVPGPAGGRVYAATESGELFVVDAVSGSVVAHNSLSPHPIQVDDADKASIIASSDSGIFALDASGEKRWEYFSAQPIKDAMMFKGLVVARTSPGGFTALNSETGRVVWQYLGKPDEGVFVTEDGFFLVDPKGAVKELAMDKMPADAVTTKEVLTELARASIRIGKPQDARVFIDMVREIDPDYAPLRLVVGDFAAYASLAGRDSPSAQPAIEELKSKHGLLWQTTVDGPAGGVPVVIGDRIVNIGRFPASETRLIARDIATGGTAWVQTAVRFVDAVAEATGRVWYASGVTDDPNALVLYMVDVRTGERRELAQWRRPDAVNYAVMALAANRVFVASVSIDSSSAIHVAVDAVDATTGVRLWQKTHDATPASPLDFLTAVSLFAPQAGRLIYSVTHDIWTVDAADGIVVDHQRENRFIAPNPSRNLLPPGPVYYAADDMHLVAYDPDAKTLSRVARPETDSSRLLIRDGVWFGVDKGAAFAFDVKSAEQKWRRAGKLLSISGDDGKLWALSEDNMLVQLDATTGDVLAQYSTLWRPSSFTVVGDRLFAFTADGLAYAVRMAR